MDHEDEWKKDFSPEELKALGEEVPADEKKPPEGEKKPDENAQQAPGKPAPGEEGTLTPEQQAEAEQKKKEEAQNQQPSPEEQEAAVKMGFRIEDGFIVDDDGTKIPPTRWKKLYYDDKEKGRQLELKDQKLDYLKRLGPDEYYKLYPDEAPAGYKPPQPKPDQDVLPLNDPRILDMNVQGGNYHGSTLREVMKIDQDAAIAIYGNYVASINDHVTRQRETESKSRQEQEDAVNKFGAARAKELFGVEDQSKLKPEQVAQINKIGREVIDWQVANRKLHLDWEDAYYLMTRDQRESRIKEEAAANALKGLQKTDTPPSIGNGGGAGGEKDLWTEMSKWTADQMEKHIDGLGEKEFTKFLKEAPASIKAKFKNVPWS